MMPLNKNQILVSTKPITNFAVGSRFMVHKGARSPQAEVTLRALDKDNKILENGCVVKLCFIGKYFEIKNEVYAKKESNKEPNSDFKKGVLLQVKKAFKTDADGVSIKVGSRAIIQKGGKKIELELACRPQAIYSINTAFLNAYFEPAEPIFDPNLQDVGIKNFKTAQGEETPFFHFDFTYKGIMAGHAKNSGNGEANSLAIYNSPELNAIFDKMIAHVVKTKGVEEFRVSEILVDYFFSNFHKGVCTFDTFAKAELA